MKNFIYLLVAVSLLTGCAAGQVSWKPEYREQIAMRTYDYNSQYVFERISALFEVNGYGFEVINKNDGIIRTMPKTSGISGLSSFSIIYYIKVTPIDENQTRVSAVISSQGSVYVPSGSVFRSGNWSPTGDEMINEKHYKNLFDSIEQTLQK